MRARNTVVAERFRAEVGQVLDRVRGRRHGRLAVPRQIEAEKTEFARQSCGEVPEVAVDPEAMQKQNRRALACRMQDDRSWIEPRHALSPYPRLARMPLPKILLFVYQVTNHGCSGANGLIPVFNNFLTPH